MVDAIQFTKRLTISEASDIGLVVLAKTPRVSPPYEWWISSPSRGYRLRYGDWIVTGENGQRCVVDGDAFVTLYEPVDDADGVA